MTWLCKTPAHSHSLSRGVVLLFQQHRERICVGFRLANKPAHARKTARSLFDAERGERKKRYPLKARTTTQPGDPSFCCAGLRPSFRRQRRPVSVPPWV